MPLNLAQIILLLIVALFLYSQLKKFIRRETKLNDLILPGMFWLAAAVVIIFPGLAQWAASMIGIGRGVDLIIYLALLAVFYFIIYLIDRQKETDLRMTMLSRKIAVMEAQDNREADSKTSPEVKLEENN